MTAAQRPQVSEAPKASALNNDQRRLAAVLDNATVSIFLMDHRQHCIYMNKAAESLTGFTLEEVVAFNRPLHDIIHHTKPDGSPFPLAECAIDRAFPEHNQVRGEELFIHRDGSFYPVSFTASPVRDDSSMTVGTIIEVRNIADEKAAQERDRLLRNELNHRVKNTLATVQSLAALTFRDHERDALDLFMGRLSALSEAHNVLNMTSWKEAPLGEIATTVLRGFGGGRIQFSGPDCSVSPKGAISLSMVLFELATNAAKYGALSVPDGSVTLSWSCTHGPDHIDLEIDWREQRGPPVTPPTKRGLGLRLIERQLALEFAGTVNLQFVPHGLQCEIHIRIPMIPSRDEVLGGREMPHDEIE